MALMMQEKTDADKRYYPASYAANNGIVKHWSCICCRGGREAPCRVIRVEVLQEVEGQAGDPVTENMVTPHILFLNPCGTVYLHS
jgi:hypothetical protein